MKSIAPVLLIVAILALLFISNPTKQDFSTWYGDQARSSAPAGGLSKVLGGIGKGMATVAASAFQRQNFGVFSIFRISKNGTAYVGLAKVLFVKIH